MENARQALMGCYGYMSADNAYGQAWQEVTFVLLRYRSLCFSSCIPCWLRENGKMSRQRKRIANIR